jgi:hypothetical protein
LLKIAFIFSALNDYSQRQKFVQLYNNTII